MTSLQSQALEEKAIYSQLNASMFTLYYAEGATISAEEKLNAAKHEMKIKAKVKTQAVDNTNLSNNLLASANQANQYFKQSINNMAVCASNVQIAANSIVRLASDIGSIFSIVHAADRNSDIFADTDKVRALIDNTAYEAEEASKLAMETSMYTSEVSAPTVFDKAKSVNTAINNLLQITSTDFDTVSQTVNADNVTLASASAKEKLAEGVLEDISVDFKATTEAYDSTNEELNINLMVGQITDTSYIVSFKAITNPFDYLEIIEDYHVIFVKENKKSIFSLSNAETIRINNIQNQFIKVDEADGKLMTGIIDFNNFLVISNVSEYTKVIDSDGEPIKFGVNYVAFVLAVYKDGYKREVNDFSDFLSAPSRKFTLTNQLQAVDGAKIKTYEIGKVADSHEKQKITVDVNANTIPVLMGEIDTIEQVYDLSDYTRKLTFQTPIKVENSPLYKCLFLPATEKLTKGLLTRKRLLSIIDEAKVTAKNNERKIKDIELTISNYDAEIKDIKAQQTTVKHELHQLALQIDKLNGANPKPKSKEETELKKLLVQQTKLTQNEADLVFVLEETKSFQKEAIENKTKIIAAVTDTYDDGNLGFFFNLTLAEQVSPSNYTTVYELLDISDESDIANKKRHKNWAAFIGPETTDNFGNLLIEDNAYYPVILTVSTDAINNPNNYTNAISSIKVTDSFKYNGNNPKK
ncbi:hypothetical protein AQF98_05250 [Pedobacter sp. Hv1]|nr:hypothetical protein AQF98_05250 [Pedobacter sp. Hv1]